jgi:branched-chain amino acid transport system substrate-binding protein
MLTSFRFKEKPFWRSKVKSKKIRLFYSIGLVLVLLASMVLTACAQKEVPAKVLKIGGHEPLTGSGASVGMPAMRGVQLAIDWVNERGGITVKGEKYLLEYTVYDNKYTAADALTVANRLVFEDKIKFVVGSVGSVPCIAVNQIFNDNKVLCVAGGAAFSVVDKKFPYTFRIHNQDFSEGQSSFTALLKVHPDVKTIYLVVGDTDWGHDQAKAYAKILPHYGLQVVGTTFIPTGTTDFYPALSPIVAMNPDVIGVGAANASLYAMELKQLWELGYKGVRFCTSALRTTDVFPMMTNEQATGIISEYAQLEPPSAYPKYVEFAERYKAKYGPPVEFMIDLCYDKVMALVTGIEKAQSLDPTDVMHVMEAEDFSWDGLFGENKFGGMELYGIRRNAAVPTVFSEFQSDGIPKPVFAATMEDLKKFEELYAEAIK